MRQRVPSPCLKSYDSVPTRATTKASGAVHETEGTVPLSHSVPTRATTRASGAVHETEGTVPLSHPVSCSATRYRSLRREKKERLTSISDAGTLTLLHSYTLSFKLPSLVALAAQEAGDDDALDF